MWYNIVLILGSLVHYCLKKISGRIATLRALIALIIVTHSQAWLYCSRPASTVSSSNNFCSCNNTHLEASLIKIPGVFIKNPIFILYILNAFKPGINKHRILTFSILVVILAIIFRL